MVEFEHLVWIEDYNKKIPINLASVQALALKLCYCLERNG